MNPGVQKKLRIGRIMTKIIAHITVLTREDVYVNMG
jgi:hypothetical protein